MIPTLNPVPAFDPVPACDPLPADPALGRLGPALARFPLHAVHLVHVEQAGSLQDGIELVDRSVDGGTGAFVVESQIDDVPALAVLAVLLHLEPIAAVGTAAQPGWAERLVAVRDRLPALLPYAGDPVALLAASGDGGLARLTGLLAQAAVRRTPVLLGGSTPVVAAALLADRLAPGAAGWWIAAEAPSSPAATAGLDRLGLDPLLDLRVAGRGGELALALLRAAAGA